MTVAEKFSNLGIDNAPGQESLQKSTVLEFRGEKIPGAAVDFSHGDVDAHEPIPGSFAAGEFVGGIHGAVSIGACAVMDCLVNGREAGRMAAQSKAWF